MLEGCSGCCLFRVASTATSADLSLEKRREDMTILRLSEGSRGSLGNFGYSGRASGATTDHMSGRTVWCISVLERAAVSRQYPT